MSAPILETSPSYDRSSADLFAFDGAEELWRSWRDGLTPDPLLNVSEWADRHRVLSSRASAEPGRYRTDLTPYMRAIMDALSPSHPCRRIVFMKAAQVGAPLAVNTPIPTAFGWRTMGCLAPGEFLFDENGQLCRVTGVSEVMTGRPCYEIVFEDGEKIVCDREHRWPVLDFTNDHPVQRTLRTEEMLWRVRIGRSKRYRFAIECCQPIDLPDQDLIIHPYVLGVWLGDGSVRANACSRNWRDLGS